MAFENGLEKCRVIGASLTELEELFSFFPLDVDEAQIGRPTVGQLRSSRVNAEELEPLNMGALGMAVP